MRRDKQLSSSCIITNSHKYYEIRRALSTYNRKNWQPRELVKVPHCKKVTWAEIWWMGVNQDKKLGKSLLDRGNSMCEIPEAKELRLPEWAKRMPEWLASREVGRDSLLQVLYLVVKVKGAETEQNGKPLVQNRARSGCCQWVIASFSEGVICPRSQGRLGIWNQNHYLPG